MFVYSIKASTIKYVGVMVLCAAAVFSAVVMIPPSNSDNVMTESAYREGLSATVSKKSADFKNIKTNDDRVKFLESYGWEVSPDAVEIVEVRIPSEFDKVFEEYNLLQKGEGLDLEKYRGKSVKRYTYTVENYDSPTTVLANVIVYKDRVVGGDICSADINGFIHGFTKTNSPHA